jgi:hypothetical protein
MESIDFACAIDPAGLKQRVDQLDSLVPQVLGLRRDGLTLTLAFPAEASQDVRAFVVEESKCCPFLSFEIDDIDQGLRLAIRTSLAVRRCWSHCRPRSPATPPSFAPGFEAYGGQPDHGDLRIRDATTCSIIRKASCSPSIRTTRWRNGSTWLGRRQSPDR